ncbi:hypothetical protein [Streptomyces sp. NPDC050504]|uniref:hypothetical protein n=1 Tax=Streptomyces sp. NPDC050504 TaxID=3365618 RepID=UPI003787C5DD
MRGPEDTVHLPGTGTVPLAVPFGTLADARIPYTYHCHVPRHEDEASRTIAPGGQGGVHHR